MPDVAEEQRRISQLTERGRRVVRHRLDRDVAEVTGLRDRGRRAVSGRVDRDRAEAAALRDRLRRCLRSRVDAAAADLAHSRARVAALSPAATLRRGYAVVQRTDGTVVRRPSDVDAGDPLRIRLAEGALAATAGGEESGD